MDCEGAEYDILNACAPPLLKRVRRFDGHDVTGVEAAGNKVEMINHSQSPIIEPRLRAPLKEE
jgi:hypothetical protein